MKSTQLMLLFVSFFCSLSSKAQLLNSNFLEAEIQKLKISQSSNGAYYPINCLNKKMTKNCKSDRSLFFTALIAEALGEVESASAQTIRNNTVSYLADQYVAQDGVLHYFEKGDPFFKIVKPDMDDNSLVYSALRNHAGMNKLDLEQKYLKLFEVGLIKARIKNKSSNEILEKAEYFATWLKPSKPFFNDIDLVVNANSLFAFALYNQQARKKVNLAGVCQTVNTIVDWATASDFKDLVSDRSWIRRKKSNYSQWYPSKYAVMFSVIRAHQVMGQDSCLKSSYQKFRKYLLSNATYDTNVYDQALATAALSRISLIEKIKPQHLEENIIKLLQQLNKKDYGKHPFYFFNVGYTGSIDLARALAIESLSNFLKNQARAPASEGLEEKEFLENILAEQMDDGSFTALIIPSSPLYNIFMVFMYEYLGQTEQKKHLTKPLIEHIFTMQKSNGALAGYPEGPDHPGISTAGYIAAKIVGYDENSPRMLKLEKRIHELGGPMKSDILTMPFLMMFSLFPLHTTFNLDIDRFLMKFSESMPWVKVLLNPVLYMLDNGHNRILSEPKFPHKIYKLPYAKYVKRQGIPKAQKDNQFLKWAHQNMNPDGTFFDYTPTTVPMLMALSTFSDQKETIEKGLTTIESFQQKTAQGFLLQTPGEASIGETFYVANVLLDVGLEHDHPTIKKAEKYLMEHQLKTGGWGFSKNSVHFADSDDTSNAMYLMIRLDKARGKEIRPEVFRALEWLLTLQNINGGFGTWERTKGRIIGNLINKVANKKGLVMSESVFEHTARIVVCLSFLRHARAEADLAYQKAYDWLLKQQKHDGSFAGTWFVDYMFSTSMAMTALGTDNSAKGNFAIQKGISYLSAQQSADGGFGESPDSFLKGKAVQLKHSSWAQTGLVVAQLHTMNAMTGCKYKNEMKGILDTTNLFLKDEKEGWLNSMDPTWTAVTFPKVEYLIYPYIQRLVPWQAYNMHLNSICR